MIKILLIFIELFGHAPKLTLLLASSAYSQSGNFYFGTNASDKSAGIWESNSPGNTHGSRRYQVLIDKDKTHWYCKRLILDSLSATSTTVIGQYFPMMTSTGEVKLSTSANMISYLNSTLTIPYSHITGSPSQTFQTLSGTNTNTFTLSNGGGSVVVPSNTITALNGMTVTSGVNSFTITQKRIETYSGTTSSSGVYSVAFTSSFVVAPNIQASLSTQSLTNQYLRVSAVSATGFTVNAYAFNTNTLLGIVSLVSTTSNLIGIDVDVLISEK